MLFEKFVEGRVWNLTAGHSYTDRDDRFEVNDIRFFDSGDGLASEAGPCAAYDDSLAGGDPEVKQALVRFERKLGNQRLAVLGSNLLNSALVGTTLHLLFEHWKVSVKDPEAGEIFRDFCESKINVFKEGEALKEPGTVCVEEIRSTRKRNSAGLAGRARPAGKGRGAGTPADAGRALDYELHCCSESEVAGQFFSTGVARARAGAPAAFAPRHGLRQAPLGIPRRAYLPAPANASATPSSPASPCNRSAVFGDTCDAM